MSLSSARPSATAGRWPRFAGAAALAACVLLGGAWWRAAPPVPAAAKAGESSGPDPAAELARLQYVGRSQPELGTVELEKLVARLAEDDPLRLEALVELGAEDVALTRGDEVEHTARRIEALELPFARPAAMAVRGHWLQLHGQVGKAQAQLIEAAALVPPDAPAWLRLRLLASSAEIASRQGRYDTAVSLYDDARRLAARSAPGWRGRDLRYGMARLMLEAGQMARARELTQEELRAATAAGDEYGISRAETLLMIELSDAGDDAGVLAAQTAALEHARRSGNGHQIVISQANLADWYLTHQDYRTAYDTSQRALALARQLHIETAESVSLANSGLALICLDRKDDGIALVRRSMALDERVGSARSIANLTAEMGRYLERCGHLADALAAYQQSRQLSAELDAEDRQRALIDQQERYANEQRQHELDLLERESRIKDEQLRHHALLLREWMAAGIAAALLSAVVITLARRLRVRNEELRASNERLRAEAGHDPLTGLANRHRFQEVMAAGRAGALEGTLLLIDVDHFKQVNDRLGHAAGDAVLVEIARRLRLPLREDDLLVRWGGEEFLLLVPRLEVADAEALARRLLHALADEPVDHDGRRLRVTASVGVASFPLAGLDGAPPHAPGWERAVSLVDAAMYAAKTRGRNGACSIRGLSVEGGDDLGDLVRALEAGEGDRRVAWELLPGPRADVAAPH